MWKYLFLSIGINKIYEPVRGESIRSRVVWWFYVQNSSQHECGYKLLNIVSQNVTFFFVPELKERSIEMAIQFLIYFPWCRVDSRWKYIFCDFYEQLQIFMKENGGECGNQGGFTGWGAMSSWNLGAFWWYILINLEILKSCILEKTEMLTAGLNWTTEDSLSGKDEAYINITLQYFCMLKFTEAFKKNNYFMFNTLWWIYFSHWLFLAIPFKTDSKFWKKSSARENISA